ncbi:hypothetical protein BDP27DRAFT_1370926 [Rhodocollybia butyracea]|uniref:Uncharacterized protein n=1 Tax=Rhodocollybia butyracea TaxID=206335 RepID=A0A9P5TZ83_9AGAR|nr:hypothetical protein BDP27DRAFT_1370926 [Rhodocollybia butyracea]
MMLASMLVLFFPSLVLVPIHRFHRGSSSTPARSGKGWDILLGAILSPTMLFKDNTYNSQEAPPDLLNKTIGKRMNVPPMWEQIGRHWDLINWACRYCTEWGCLIQNGMSDERMSMGQSSLFCDRRSLYRIHTGDRRSEKR